MGAEERQVQPGSVCVPVCVCEGVCVRCVRGCVCEVCVCGREAGAARQLYVAIAYSSLIVSPLLFHCETRDCLKTAFQ